MKNVKMLTKACVLTLGLLGSFAECNAMIKAIKNKFGGLFKTTKETIKAKNNKYQPLVDDEEEVQIENGKNIFKDVKLNDQLKTTIGFDDLKTATTNLDEKNKTVLPQIKTMVAEYMYDNTIPVELKTAVAAMTEAKKTAISGLNVSDIKKEEDLTVVVTTFNNCKPEQIEKSLEDNVVKPIEDMANDAAIKEDFKKVKDVLYEADFCDTTSPLIINSVDMIKGVGKYYMDKIKTKTEEVKAAYGAMLMNGMGSLNYLIDKYSEQRISKIDKNNFKI